MKIEIYHLIEGARKAEGLTVIIDVFRAFSLECYLCAMGASQIRPVGTIKEAFAWRERDKDCILIGERHGRMCEGFDFGNSPSTVIPEKVRDKRIIHTTSAGTKGVINATGAEEIITGSLVNARAVAEYIKYKKPEKVSLVCMGKEGAERAKEDELCAEYIKSLIEDRKMADLDERVKSLRFKGGEHFFDPDNQEVFPEADFYKCIEYDKFDFVLKIRKDDQGFIVKKISPF
ncbi:MAG: 2-phosphosulfolactate phosphatase [Lachnospiraceae bacterium]|nr:2-phosphosulfolactate phosphatase [Lachnospiraceae bacterium]